MQKKIYEIYDVDPNHPDWRMSTFRGTVIIRAKDEDEAYSIATQEFITAAEVPEGIATPTATNPWSPKSSATKYKEVLDGDWNREGESEVLMPISPMALLRNRYQSRSI